MFSVGYCRSSNAGVVDSSVLVQRPISICAGDRPISSIGVFQ